MYVYCAIVHSTALARFTRTQITRIGIILLNCTILLPRVS